MGEIKTLADKVWKEGPAPRNGLVRQVTDLIDEFTAGGLGDETTVASAGTVDLGAADTIRYAITGTTTITSFGTSPDLLRLVRFTGALTLTYNATSLILPQEINMVTRAGDTALLVSDASGNWKVYMFQSKGARWA